MAQETTTKCPHCGEAIASQTAFGLCPRCLLANLDEEEPESDAPRIFGDYEILQEIASGGMGTIFKARQRSLERVVALKVITGGSLASREVVERFRNEAQAAASLSHPHIVPIHEVGECDGQLFFSMEFIDGPSLDHFLRGRPFSLHEGAQMLIKIARAVHFAHQRGILHRDLKPGNILIDAAHEPRLTDFGLAKVLEKDSALTQTKAWLGTPSYMSPEQASGAIRDVTISTDVYGLGAVLYELLTGQPPFAGGTTFQTVRQVLEMEPRKPTALNARVDADLEIICLKCLEKEPADRYGSALSVAEELERWIQHEPIMARAVGPLERAKKWVRRRPNVAALTFAFTAAVLLGMAATIHQWLRAEEKSASAAESQRHAERLVTRLDLERAEDHLLAGQRPEALALLAGVLRADPSNRVAAERIFSFLNHHTLALPILEGFGSGEKIRSMMPSVDGNHVAFGRIDGAIQIWNTANAQLEWSISNDSEVTNPSWSHDGRYLTTGFFDKKIRVWDTATHQQVSPDLRNSEVPFPLFSHDSERIIVWAWLSPKVRILKWRTGEWLREIDIGQPVRGVRSSSSAEQFYAATATTLQLWDVDGKRVQSYERSGFPNVGASSPDGRIVAASIGTKGIVFCDGATLNPLPFQIEEDIPEGRPTFSPDGLLLVMGEQRRVGELRDLRTGRAINIPLLHGDSGRLAWLLGDGRHLLTSGTEECGARLSETAPGAVLAPPLRHRGSITSATFDPSGTRIFTTSSDRTARLWNAESGLPLTRPIAHEAPVADGFFSPAGDRFATVARDNVVRVWNGEDAKLLAALPHSETVYSSAFSADGNRLASATDGGAWIWDLTQSPPPSQKLAHKTSVRFVAFDPLGSYIATGSTPPERELLDTASYLTLWRSGEANPLATIEIPNRLMAFSISPSGKFIAYGAQNGTIGIWDVKQSAWRLRKNAHRDRVSSIRFSADDEWILTAGRDRVSIMLNSKTGEHRYSPQQHDEPVAHAEFSRRGNRMVTLTTTGTLRLWDVEMGMPLTDPLRDVPGSLKAATPSLQGSLLSPDGKHALAVTGDHSVRALEIPAPPLPAPSWLADLAETIVGRRLASSRLVEELNWSEYLRLREQLKNISGNDFYAQWARWFFADRATRTISPWSKQTIPEYARARAEEKTIDSLFEAIRLQPTNPVVLERLGRALTAGKAGGLLDSPAAGELLLQRARQLAQTNLTALPPPSSPKN